MGAGGQETESGSCNRNRRCYPLPARRCSLVAITRQDVTLCGPDTTHCSWPNAQRETSRRLQRAANGDQREAGRSAVLSSDVVGVKPPAERYLLRMPVHVTSEIGALRTVLVHSPGNELLAVTPSTRADFLYDDIVDADLAKREHRRFVQVLERFCEVLHVRDLLTDVLEDPEVRELIIRETLDVVPLEPLASDLRGLPPEAVVNLLIEGKEEEPGPLSRTLNESSYSLPPLPQLLFTRDSAMAINQKMLLGSAGLLAAWASA